MAYAAASDVFAHVRSLIAPASAFSASTTPAEDEVTFWLSSGSSLIDARLAGAGYGPIPTTSAAFGLATVANALYGAWMAERSRVNAMISADERTRADMFKRDFEFHLEQLVMLDLSRMGVPRAAVGRAFAGGISRGDKAARQADGDRVPSRFTRGQFGNPESLRPSGRLNAS